MERGCGGHLGKRFDELQVGDKGSNTVRVTEQDVLLYMGVSGDLNPLYNDTTYAGRTKYERPVVPVNLIAGLVAGAISRELPGRGTVTISHHYRMVQPAHCGDELTVSIQVVELRDRREEAVLRTEVTNVKGETIVVGELVVEPPPKLKQLQQHVYESF